MTGRHVTPAIKVVGVACPHGHTLRYSKDGRCVECQTIRSKAYHKTHAKVIRARVVKWRADNPERTAAQRKRRWQSEKAKAIGRAWRQNNPQKHRRARGLPEPAYPSPLVCEICQNPPSVKNLCLDHDHKTGLFRGWICRHCNVGLGNFKDSPELLRKAARYVEKR